MTTDTCDWSAREEVFEGYVRGALGPEERDAFEDHYFTCPSCLAKVRAYDGLQTELRTMEAEAPAGESVPARPWRWALVPAAAALVLVAALVLLLRNPAPSTPDATVAVAPAVQPPAPVPPTAPPATAAPSVAVPSGRPPAQLMPAPAEARTTPRPAAPPVVALSVLARVTPPPYAPAVLRGPQDAAGAKFEAAMRLYVKRDYAGAIPGLDAAAGLRPDVPHYAFFVAVCNLMTDRLDLAVAGLEKTISLGESPYLEEAHFYLAKARLRQGDIPAAREELGRTIARQGRLEDEARRLLAQVNALPQGR